MFQDKLLACLAEMGPEPDYARAVAEVLGIRGAQPELARRLVTQALLIEDRHETWSRVGQSVCRRAPGSPGVYVFQDADGRALYVGKAVNLRRRLRAHFADRRWLTLKPPLARVVAVEWQEVGSEIEALVREATLIRELNPVVNVQVRTPALHKRIIPRALLRDVIVVVPSAVADSAELLAARTDGASLLQRAARNGTGLIHEAERLWRFFQAPSRDESNDCSLAPLVFSWLAGRGRDATRLDPHDASSSDCLHAALARLLLDKHLFSERIVRFW